MKITIGHFYPELLNMYGDLGNIITLKKRLEWRGIEAEIKEISLEDTVDFSNIDIAVIGGGSDREQLIAIKELAKVRDELKSFAEDGGVILATCGSYHLLGKYCYFKDEKTEGLSVLDIYTENGESRMISNVVIDTAFGKAVGFENHSGKTYINNHEPLGKVVFGSGNNGEDGYEGVVYKNVFGTNLHGPLLPKNPELADEIIKRALQRKYPDIILEKLDDSNELRAKDYIVKKYTKEI